MSETNRHCFAPWTILIIAALSIGLTGCGEITGESPKIASKETPAPKADSTLESASAGDVAASTTPAADSGWNAMADRAFGLPVVERPTTGAQAGTALPDGQPTPATPVSTEPALTAPDPALADAPGLYLRQAQDTRVNWRTWGDAAFAEAASRNVPLIIVIGAAWSHDARLMDKQVFSDETVATALNQKFVPIRVDADTRPGIWSRYRLAFEVINKQRARPPLVVFAMPDGTPFDVVSAVPAQTQGDIVGLEQLLVQTEELMASQPTEVKEQSAAIEKVLAQLLIAPRANEVEFSKDVVQEMAKELSSAASGSDADSLRAGRVSGYLLHNAADNSSENSKSAGSELLLDRFRSGQRDHVMGGYFFRIPGSGEIQFGKVLPVQSEMITANARAYVLTNKGLHKEGVTEVLRFCRDWLEDRDGGFYTCQTPDVGDSDTGAYFTWSQEEIEEIADDSTAAKVFITYLNAEAGKKTNLHVTNRLSHAADVAGVSYDEALKDLDEVRLKLHDARMTAEQVPVVDKSILAGWNGDMICAYLQAAKLIGDDQAKEFALKSADRIIETMVSEQDGVARVFYKGKASGFGYLEDNVKVAAALMACYRASDQDEYLESATSLMNYVEARFIDRDSGLYMDVVDTGTSDSLGLLRLTRLPLEDEISRAPNAVAAMVWYQLHDVSKNDEYKERGDRLVNAALSRRPFTTEAVATWGEASLMSLNGLPSYEN